MNGMGGLPTHGTTIVLGVTRCSRSYNGVFEVASRFSPSALWRTRMSKAEDLTAGPLVIGRQVGTSLLPAGFHFTQGETEVLREVRFTPPKPVLP